MIDEENIYLRKLIKKYQETIKLKDQKIKMLKMNLDYLREQTKPCIAIQSNN